MIGRGVAYRKTEEADLCWSDMVETGVLFIGRGVAYRKTGLQGYCSSPPSTPPASTSYCSSTVDLLQPPPATINPRAPVHPASTARYSTGYCSTSPLHGLLFNHPSIGYCSSSPPPSTVHSALHGVVLFILPSTGSCSSSPNRLDRSGSRSSSGNTTGSCSSNPHRELFIETPQQRSLYIQRQHHEVLFIHPHRSLFIHTPPATLTVNLEAASIGFS